MCAPVPTLLLQTPPTNRLCVYRASVLLAKLLTGAAVSESPCSTPPPKLCVIGKEAMTQQLQRTMEDIVSEKLCIQRWMGCRTHYPWIITHKEGNTGLTRAFTERGQSLMCRD